MEFQQPPLTCLFCNTGLCLVKREVQNQHAVDNLRVDDEHCDIDLENPPLLSTSIPQDALECVGGFWRAFKLFCKLLGNESESQRKSADQLLSMMEDDDESSGDFQNHLMREQPSCRECHSALMNVLRLQLVVEQSLAKQRDYFEVLKLSITNNLDNPILSSSIWEAVRTQLIDCLNLKLKRVKQEANYIWDSSEAEASTSPLSIYGDNNMGTTNSTVQEILQFTDEVTGTGDRNRQPHLAGRLSADDSKKVDGGSAVKIKPCSVKLCKLSLEDISSLQKSKQKASYVSRVKRRKKGGGIARKLKEKPNVPYHFNDVFFRIGEDILLFQCTPIRVSQASFNCLEPGCTHVENGSDYYFAFKNMTAHIVSYHEENYECKETSRGCPLCDESFINGVSLRRHLISEHSTGTKSTNTKVVCPSCFKTIHYSKHRNHLWLHKSEGEKAEAVASGEKPPRPQKRWYGPAKNKKQNRVNKLKVDFTATTSKSEFKLKTAEKIKFEKQNEVIESKANLKATKSKTKANINEGVEKIKFEKQKKVNKPKVDLKTLTNLKNGVKTEKKMKYKKRKRKAQDGVSVKEEPLFYMLGENLLLYKHILIQHTPSEFTCQVRGCRIGLKGSDYFTFQEFKSHVKTCHRPHIINSTDRYIQEPKYVCPLCKTEFWEGEEFSSHVHSEHSPPPVCVSCWKPLESAADMGEHVKSHMNSEELLALSRPSPDRPFRKVYPPKELGYTCKICNKQFEKYCSIWSHEKTHVPKHLRPHFDCPECGMQLLSKPGLQAHIDRKHRPNLVTRKRVCPICKREFYFRDGERFRIHMRGHTGETPWLCQTCGKRFSSQGQYATHLKVHTDEQNYQCEFCAKRYKQRSALKLHQRKAHKGLVKEMDPEQKLKVTHNLEHRPGFIGPKIAYPCQYCEKIFQIRSLMTKHVSKSHPQH